MRELEDFKIFKSRTLGQMFMPEGLSYKNNKMLIPTIAHGRSVAIKVSDYRWVLVKGGGWNYGGPSVYISKKDAELVFGLYSKKSAERELSVSKALETISANYPKVLYYKSFCDYPNVEELKEILNARFSSGAPVDPCLLYTEVRYPYRVADLMYLSDADKRKVIKDCCSYWNVNMKSFVPKFIEVFANNVAMMHRNGFVNDTLEFSNVTMLGEIVDYELITAPGIPLFDAKYDEWKIPERREKEILYGAEVVLQLNNLLNKKSNLYDCYSAFVYEYSKRNSIFIDNNENVKAVLNQKDVIL